MPNKAKLYVTWVAAAGLILLATALFQWSSPHPARLLVFSLLTLLAATRKVRLPGLTSTMSVSFLFYLIAIADYTFSETIVLAAASAIVQSLWKAKRRPKLVQVVFNVAALIISVGAAHWGSHRALAALQADSLPALLALATFLYFVTNTGLVAIVLCLAEDMPLQKVWQQCYAFFFPYCLVGAALAGVVSTSSRSAGWKASLLVLPVMYLTYLYYRMRVADTPAPDARAHIQLSPEGL